MARAIRAGELSALELFDAHAARIAERDPEVNALVLPRLDEARAEAAAADLPRARRAAPRRPVHGEGPDRGRGHALPERLAAARRPRDEEDAEAVRRVRGAGGILLGKTNVSESRIVVGLGQPGVRRDPEPARPDAHGRRLLGRRGRGDRVRDVAPRTRLRPRRLDPEPVPLLRRLRAQDESRHRAVRRARAAPARPGDPADGRRRADGPLRRGSRARAQCARAGRAAGGPAGADRRVRDGRPPAGEPRLPRSGAPRGRGAGRRGIRRRRGRAAERRRRPGRVRHAARAPGAPPLRPLVGGRLDESCRAYIREMVEAGRGFVGSWEAYLAASKRLAAFEVEAEQWLADTVGLCPCAPETAPPLGGAWSKEIDGEPTRPGGKLTLATYASALGLPAVCVPVMRSPARLPVGVQLIGRRGSERTLLALARVLEEALGGWLDPDEARSALTPSSRDPAATPRGTPFALPAPSGRGPRPVSTSPRARSRRTSRQRRSPHRRPRSRPLGCRP